MTIRELLLLLITLLGLMGCNLDRKLGATPPPAPPPLSVQAGQ